MSERFTKVLFLLVLFSTMGFAQTPITITLTPYGVSPREAGLSTTDIYKYQYTALHNVGVGTMMYIKVQRSSGKLESPKWSAIQYPSGSKPVFSSSVDVLNDSTQVIAFTPDKAGKYIVQVVDGLFVGTMTINSAKYLGYQNSVVNGVDTKVTCKTCHSSKVSEWEGTGHASMFTRAMNGTPGLSGPTDHYSKNCISCHTTGYDKDSTAVNDGFDDLTFTYPTVLAPGTYDQLVVNFPDAMKRANIQCESCHGPASNHVGDTRDFRMEVSYDYKVCAYCHDDGNHHIFPEQFAVSGHAVTVNESGAGREACVRCHTGVGFVQFANNIQTTDPLFDNSYTPITCAVCHDPHDATNEYQLRKVDASILGPNKTSVAVTDAGTGTICFNCHQSRTEAGAAVAGVGTSAISSRFGPHHGPQGDLLVGSNLLELGGIKLTKTNHIGVTEDACVKCHMYPNAKDASGKVMLSGSHSFAMSSPDGEDNMNACIQCHGSTFGNSFDQARFFYNGEGDLDGDGTIEGLQDEVKHMIALIMNKLPIKAGATSPVPDKTWTADQLSAYWNAITVQEDRSFGIHNPKYIVSGLFGAMNLVGIVTDVKSNTSEIPTEYTLYQNYPNPFNPSTNIRFALPKESHVKLTIYDITGKQIETIINDQLAAGTHTIEWAPKNIASGVYLYRVEAGNFVKVNKMIFMK
jgi:hypothetical protein